MITRDDIIKHIKTITGRSPDTRAEQIIIAVSTLLADQMAVLERKLEEVAHPVVHVNVPSATERGNEIHRRIEQLMTVDPGNRPVIQLHDEVVYEPIHPEWRCANKACPQRPPTRAATAPRCYTCERPMAKHDPIGPMIDAFTRHVAAGCAMPVGLLKADPALSPTWDELKAKECIESRRAWRPATLGVSACQTATGADLDYIAKLQNIPPRCTRSPVETDEGLRARIEARRVAAASSRPERKVVAAFNVYPGVLAIHVNPLKSGRLSILCSVSELTDAIQRRLGLILDDILPAATDWQLDCVPPNKPPT